MSGVTASKKRPISYNARQIAIMSQVTQHVGVGGAQIGVEQHNLPAHLRQTDRQIDRDVTLSYPPFAAGNRNDPCTSSRRLFYQVA